MPSAADHILPLSVVLCYVLLVSDAYSLVQVFPQPVLLNPSFEDYCTNGTGFFFAPDPSAYFDSGLKNISSSNSVALMKWNITGLGLEVISGGASDGDCYLSPFWAREPGGVNQTLTTAPNASYLVRFDMMVYAVVCGDSFPGLVSIEVSTGGQNATKYSGSSIGPWSSTSYQFQASSYQTELLISGSPTGCGIGVDNVRVELVREPSSNVFVNGGFESASGISEDPGSMGFQLEAGSQALSSWKVTGNGVTCFGASFFPPTEGQRLVWLATQNSLTQDPGGLQQTVATEPRVLYHISFDSACQCASNSNVTALTYCALEVDVGSDSLNFTIQAQNHTAGNPGWSRRVVEFVAVSNLTTVGFQDAAQSQRVYAVPYHQCAPYLDNVVMSIPAQQVLLRLKNGLGSPSSLMTWSNVSDPCLIPPMSNATWVGVSCSGVDVIGLDLSASGLLGSIPIELLALYQSLQSLNLSNNLISGSIPAFLGGMRKLVTLDLSHNSLRGAIPTGLGNLFLEELNLQGNKLYGVIPSTLALPSLKVLNLQMNNLSGSVPQGISLLRDMGTVLIFTPGNEYLCSESTKDLLKSCNHSGLASPTSDHRNRLPATLGGSAAGIVALGMVLLIIYRIRHSKGSSKANQVVDLKLDTCQAFSLPELEEATMGFSVILGKGGYGMVYKANLKDGSVAAVKRLNQVSRQGPHEFISELKLLSRLHHTNLVRLLGYCIEYREHILVYEFMPKGSLYEILHNPAASQQPLAWADRMKIALHMAFGIEYLHYFAKPGLVHRDIKSANILLDENNNAKVADFGLCKEAPAGAEEPQTTAVKGSFGYLDPAYVKTNTLSSKSDVFSYGVILLELITGRKAFTEGELLTEWCKQFDHLGVSSMLDPTLGMDYVEEELLLIMSVARACLIEERGLRPNMRTVVHRLCEGLPRLVQPVYSDYTLPSVDILEEEEQLYDDYSSVLYPR